MKQVSNNKDNLKIAVIDLGSNTFHLMIVSLLTLDKQFHLLHRERKFVYLAKDGISFLTEETINRGIINLSALLDKCKLYNVSVIKAIGTAALRSAFNADTFINKVQSKFKLNIEIISGKREAELIHKGIAFSGIEMTKPCLIVDIGGGSVEFIIVSNDDIKFYDSYNIGISQLRHQFKSNDPIIDNDIQLIYSYLDSKLADFFNHAKEFKVEFIIGASGPFEIIESMCHIEIAKKRITQKDKILNMIEKVIQLPLKERENLSLMPTNRADLSVESLLIIKYLFIRLRSLEGVVISPYALKEGLISEMI